MSKKFDESNEIVLLTVLITLYISEFLIAVMRICVSLKTKFGVHQRLLVVIVLMR